MNRVLTAIALVVVVTGACSPTTAQVRADWWLERPAEGGELSLVVYTNGSSCTSYSHVEVDESPDVVEVRAFDDVQRTGGCTDDYTTHRTDITLDGPLADRRLTGCVAPEGGVRAPDLSHDDTDNCRTRTPDAPND